MPTPTALPPEKFTADEIIEKIEKEPPEPEKDRQKKIIAGFTDGNPKLLMTETKKVVLGDEKKAKATRVVEMIGEGKLTDRDAGVLIGDAHLESFMSRELRERTTSEILEVRRNLIADEPIKEPGERMLSRVLTLITITETGDTEGVLGTTTKRGRRDSLSSEEVTRALDKLRDPNLLRENIEKTMNYLKRNDVPRVKLDQYEQAMDWMVNHFYAKETDYWNAWKKLQASVKPREKAAEPEKREYKPEVNLRSVATAGEEDQKAVLCHQIRENGYIPLAIKRASQKAGQYEIYTASLYQLELLSKPEDKEKFLNVLAQELAIKIWVHNKDIHPAGFKQIAETMCTPDYRGGEPGPKDKGEPEILARLLPKVNEQLEKAQVFFERRIKEKAKFEAGSFEGTETYDNYDTQQITKTQRKWHQEGLFAISMPPARVDSSIGAELRGLNIENLESATETNEVLALESVAENILTELQKIRGRLPRGGNYTSMEDWIKNRAFSYTNEARSILTEKERQLLEKLKGATLLALSRAQRRS